MQHIMNPPAIVHQDHMVPDHHIPIPARHRPQPHQQIVRHGTIRPPHLRREHKPLVNIRFPLAVPVASLVMVERIVMMRVPIARLVAIVIVEPVVIVMVPIVVMISVVVMLLRAHNRGARAQPTNALKATASHIRVFMNFLLA